MLTGPCASISIAFLTDNFWKPSKITWKQIWANNSTQTLYKNWKHWKYQVRQHRWKQKVMVHHNNLWSEVSARHAEFSQFPMFLLQNSRICRVYLWGLFFFIPLFYTANRYHIIVVEHLRITATTHLPQVAVYYFSFLIISWVVKSFYPHVYHKIKPILCFQFLVTLIIHLSSNSDL